ncbi:MAG: zinc transport system ATP-binding protein, partial [Porticoccaceae bacterium]
MSKLLLTLETIHKAFGGKSVIDNVSLSLHQGEITTLIGPNGAGKSTLAKIILGLIKPDSGLRKTNPDIRIGYMPQKITIDPTLPIST